MEELFSFLSFFYKLYIILYVDSIDIFIHVVQIQICNVNFNLMTNVAINCILCHARTLMKRLYMFLNCYQ